MIYNLVTALVVPGKMSEYNEIHEKKMMPLFPKLGMKLVGTFHSYTGNMNEVYHLFVYNDLTARQKSQDSAKKSKDYQIEAAKLSALTTSQTFTLLEPNPWSPMK